MTDTFHCDNKDALVTYLYGECSPDERATLEAHLLVCVGCAQEVHELGETRTTLAAWTSPEAPTGFRVDDAVGMKPPAIVLPMSTRVSSRPVAVSADAPEPIVAPWWARPLPAWAQVAAAAVVFAVGMALGAAQSSSPARMASGAAPGAAVVPVAEVSRSIDALKQEVASLRQANASAATATSSASVVRQVEGLIRDSEERQRQELARRTVQLVRDFDLQRRADLVTVQQAIGQIQGTTGAEVRQHRDAIEDLMRRVSQTGR